MNEQRFIEQCKAGDEYALGILYTRYADKMKKLCSKYVKDKNSVEDIVHDGFLIIMTQMNQLKDSSKLENWMSTIIRNLALRHISKMGKATLVSIEDIEENESFSYDTVRIVSEYKELLRIVDTLPDGYKRVFKCSVFEGMTHKEIGQLLGINTHSSSSQLSRAKEMLRTLVTDYGFVPIVVIYLLYTTHLDMPTNITTQKGQTTKGISPVCKRVSPKNKMLGAKCDSSVTKVTMQTDTIASQQTDSTEEKVNTLPYIPNVHIADATQYPEKKKEERNKWYVSVSYSSAGDANDITISEKQGGILSNTGTEVVETKTHHYMPFTLSLSLHNNLTSKFSIGTGLRYTRLKTDITTTDKYETRMKTKTVHYVGIPLSVSYNLWHTGKLSLYSSAGIAVDIPISGSKKWQWSLSTGVGLQYKLTPSVSLFAEPNLNYHINSSHSTQTIWDDQPFDITVPVGLRFSW